MSDLQALAIEAYMDWKNMSFNPAKERDASWLYPKWKEELKTREALGFNLAALFSRDALTGMGELVRCLMEEAYCEIHGVAYDGHLKLTSEMLASGENKTSRVYEKRPTTRDMKKVLAGAGR